MWKGASFRMEEQRSKKLKIVIVILASLLIISAALLAGILAVRHFSHSEAVSVELPDNILTPEDAFSQEGTGHAQNNPESEIGHAPNTLVSETAGTTPASSTRADALSLHSRKPEENVSFQVTNMFPGDGKTKYYRIRVFYKDSITVRYHADIRHGYEKLAEVLKVRIRLPETGELLYDGLMRDMPESLNHELDTNKSTQSELYYEITAYLDTSVGNEYMDKELIADFRWWVEETGNLDAPKNGDVKNVCLWICLATGALLLFILFGIRRKEAADEKQ